MMQQLIVYYTVLYMYRYTTRPHPLLECKSTHPFLPKPNHPYTPIPKHYIHTSNQCCSAGAGRCRGFLAGAGAGADFLGRLWLLSGTKARFIGAFYMKKIIFQMFCIKICFCEPEPVGAELLWVELEPIFFTWSRS